MISVLLALFAAATPAGAEPDLKPVYRQIARRHGEAVERLQRWIALPSIAAEGLNSEAGAQRMIELLKDAGFQRADKVSTRGKPGVFAIYDAGAPKSVGLYFMYDVKQFDAKEWSSPPLEARLVDRPGLGKIMIGRGAVNQKGPEAAFLAALHAIRGAGLKPPVNLVLVAEGEEEIGSPHFAEIVRKPEIAAALVKTLGVFMPGASQGIDGDIGVMLGAKGLVEVELICSGEKWGRGPSKDVHSAYRAEIDSPIFHLVQALDTLVDAAGDPAIDGFADKARPLSPEERMMVEAEAQRSLESTMKNDLSVLHWSHDANWREALANLYSKPTVNIEGISGGYVGAGGKTLLPHRAMAKLDLRIVPDMTYDGSLAALKAHLARRGFGDIEVVAMGGYDPTSTNPNTELIQKQLATYKAYGLDPQLSPRNAGSYPGWVFTGAPLKLPAGHFGLGHGSQQHAPDEYFLIDSTNPKIRGYDDAVRSFVDYLYELAR